MLLLERFLRVEVSDTKFCVFTHSHLTPGLPPVLRP